MANTYTQFSFAITDLTPDERAWVEAELHEEEHMAQRYGDDWYCGFQAEVENDSQLWMYADESGTPEHAAAFVQTFLEKFRPNDIVGFEWADWTSKLVLDGFGGGAVVITATGQAWMASSSWLGQQMAKGRLTAGGSLYGYTPTEMKGHTEGYHAKAMTEAEHLLEHATFTGHRHPRTETGALALHFHRVEP